MPAQNQKITCTQLQMITNNSYYIIIGNLVALSTFLVGNQVISCSCVLLG